MNNNKHCQLFNTIALIVIFLFSTTNVFAKEYAEACSTSAEDAREQLALNIDAKVKKAITDKTEAENNSLFEFYTRDTSVITEQKTDVALCGTETFKRDGKTCMKLTDQSSVCAKNHLLAQIKNTATSLPADNQTKVAKAKDWLASINSYRPFYNYLNFEVTESKSMDKLRKVEDGLLSVFNQQFINFNVKGENIEIVLDDEMSVKPYQSLILKSGAHSYVISSPGSCKIQKGFDLSKTKSKTVTHDMAKNKFPVVTFRSNVNDVKISVAGDPVKLNARKTFGSDFCHANIAYSYDYKGNIKTGTVQLKPGYDDFVNKSFTVGPVLKTAKAYKAGNFWQVLFESVNPTSKNNNIDSLTGIKIGRMTHFNFYRYGYQFAAASGEKDSYTVEANYSVKFQLTDYANGTEALFLGPVVFIPHVGLDAGIAYHKLDGKDSFESKKDSSAKKLFQSYFLLRYALGFEATFNKDIAISFNYARGLIMNKSNIYSSGIIFRW